MKDLEIFDTANSGFSERNCDFHTAFWGIWTSIFISMAECFFSIKVWDLRWPISHKAVYPIKYWIPQRCNFWWTCLLFYIGKTTGKQFSQAWNVGIPCFQTEPCSQQQISFAHLTPDCYQPKHVWMNQQKLQSMDQWTSMENKPQVMVCYFKLLDDYGNLCLQTRANP